jgi:inner membrane transporter RhtA
VSTGAERRAAPDGRGSGGIAMVLSASLLVQLSTALATTTFDVFGTFGTGALRIAASAALLLAVVRPRLRGRTARDWASVGLMGAALVAMSLGLYSAIERIPLGSAMAIMFAGPLSVAVLSSRRRLDLLWVALAAAGIVLVTHAVPSGSLSGVGFALGAAAAWGAYLRCSTRVGERFGGFDGLALAIGFGALLTAPVALGAVTSPGPRWTDLAVVGLLAVVGFALPFALEFAALRRIGVRVVSVLLSLDPVVAAVVGLVVLGQRLDAWQVVGIGLVTAASYGAVRGARAPAAG